MTQSRQTDSPRRALLEEVLEERSKVVAALPIDDQDPPAGSWLWSFGATRLVGAARLAKGPRKRHALLQLCVLAIAWLERFDTQAQAEVGGEGLGVSQ